MKTTFTITSNNPKTIFNKLLGKLGRPPTCQELRDEVRRIIASSK